MILRYGWKCETCNEGKTWDVDFEPEGYGSKGARPLSSLERQTIERRATQSHRHLRDRGIETHRKAHPDHNVRVIAIHEPAT